MGVLRMLFSPDRKSSEDSLMIYGLPCFVLYL